jgi:hypothetical protein
VTPVAHLLTIRDARAVAEDLRRLAATDGLARLVPSHGDLVAAEPAAVLRAVAARLG